MAKGWWATRQEQKKEKKTRDEKVEDRRSFRLSKIAALTKKFYAVAAKRKWLVFMILAAVLAYVVIFQGGFSFGGILETVKGFF